MHGMSSPSFPCVGVSENGFCKPDLLCKKIMSRIKSDPERNWGLFYLSWTNLIRSDPCTLDAPRCLSRIIKFAKNVPFRTMSAMATMDQKPVIWVHFGDDRFGFNKTVTFNLGDFLKKIEHFHMVLGTGAVLRMQIFTIWCFFVTLGTLFWEVATPGAVVEKSSVRELVLRFTSEFWESCFQQADADPGLWWVPESWNHESDNWVPSSHNWSQNTPLPPLSVFFAENCTILKKFFGSGVPFFPCQILGLLFRNVLASVILHQFLNGSFRSGRSGSIIGNSPQDSGRLDKCQRWDNFGWFTKDV